MYSRSVAAAFLKTREAADSIVSVMRFNLFTIFAFKVKFFITFSSFCFIYLLFLLNINENEKLL